MVLRVVVDRLGRRLGRGGLGLARAVIVMVIVTVIVSVSGRKALPVIVSATRAVRMGR